MRIRLAAWVPYALMGTGVVLLALGWLAPGALGGVAMGLGIVAAIVGVLLAILEDAIGADRVHDGREFRFRRTSRR